MMPAPSVHDRSDARHSCWLSAGTVRARSAALDLPAVTSQVFSGNVPTARPHPHAHPILCGKPIAAIAPVQAPHLGFRR